MTHSVTWADFYLICFAVGLCLSFFSFVLGGGGHSGRLHLPHFHGHAGGAHLHSAGVPAAHGPAGASNEVPVPQYDRREGRMATPSTPVNQDRTKRARIADSALIEIRSHPYVVG